MYLGVHLLYTRARVQVINSNADSNAVLTILIKLISSKSVAETTQSPATQIITIYFITLKRFKIQK
jgi:hypothetical protein